MSTHPYNIWPPSESFPCPSIVSRRQRELNLVAGFAPNGYPMLRLEWGSTCTMSETNADLKYYYSTRERQTGWGVHVFDSAGNVIRTLNFTMKDKVPEPDKYRGCAFPIMIKEQIGIPRFWISQYIPPTLIGPWDEVRGRVLTNTNAKADIGEYPRHGFYWRGFHMLAQHGPNGSGVTCCTKANDGRVKCFGLYREPSELDILYCSELHKQATLNQDSHSWMEAADDTTMRKVLMNLNNKKEETAAKEREEMKLRIRDAFRTHRGRYTARKGVDTFFIHRP